MRGLGTVRHMLDPDDLDVFELHRVYWLLLPGSANPPSHRFVEMDFGFQQLFISQSFVQLRGCRISYFSDLNLVVVLFPGFDGVDKMEGFLRKMAKGCAHQTTLLLAFLMRIGMSNAFEPCKPHEGIYCHWLSGRR